MSTSYLTEYKEIFNHFKFEMIKMRRARKFVIVTLISLFTSLLFYMVPVLTDTDFEDTASGYLASVFSFVPFLFILLALFLAADSINREHSEATDLLIYPLPQRRSNVIIAKFTTSFLVGIYGLILYYLVVAGTVFLIYGVGSLPNGYINSFLYSVLYLSTILSFAFFISASFKSTAASMTLTFFGIQILLPLLNLLLGLADIDTTWIFTNYSIFIQETMGVSATSLSPGGDTTLDFIEGLIYLVLHTIMFQFAALFIGTRREVGT
jgi:ABC-type transport system involved in multi-copper enzyme maturation permease subunit